MVGKHPTSTLSQALYDSCGITACNIWDIERGILGFIVFEIGLKIRSVVDQCAGISMFAFPSGANAAAESDCKDVIDPEEIPDDVLQCHEYLRRIFASTREVVFWLWVHVAMNNCVNTVAKYNGHLAGGQSTDVKKDSVHRVVIDPKFHREDSINPVIPRFVINARPVRNLPRFDLAIPVLFGH